MLEGHTVHALLLEDLRTFDSLAYTIWYNVRGFTAPIFMFTAGTVLVYLLFKSGEISFSNPRIKKGFKRALYLLIIGYLLRFPTFSIEGWSHISETQWKIFSSVDALHLIGVSIVMIILISIISIRTGLNQYTAFILASLFFFLLTPFTRQILWIDYFPRAIASYFTEAYGSIFPLFPWSGYLFAGAIYGYFLFRNVGYKRKTILFGFSLGGAFVLISLLTDFFQSQFSGVAASIQFSYSIYLLRIGVVLILCSSLILLTFRINSLPRIIQLLGKHSLVIYAVHLMIVYGSALSPGLSWYYGKIFSLPGTILIFLLITILMLLLAWLIELYKRHKLKIYNTIYVYYKRISSGVK